MVAFKRAYPVWIQSLLLAKHSEILLFLHTSVPKKF